MREVLVKEMDISISIGVVKIQKNACSLNDLLKKILRR
jgi:hypothetical protein